MSVATPLPHDSAHPARHRCRALHRRPAGAGRHAASGLRPVGGRRAARSPRLDLAAVRAAPGVVAVLTAEDLPFANDVSPSTMTSRCWRRGRSITRASRCSWSWRRATLPRARRRGWARVEYRGGDADPDRGRGAGRRQPLRGRAAGLDEGRCGRGACTRAAPGAGPDRDGRAGAFLPRGAGGAGAAAGGGRHARPFLDPASDRDPAQGGRGAGPADARVRVEVRRMGGGFGGKESQGNALAVACAVAARLTGRPARCAMTATTT